jgi:hypothetical protein
MRRNKGGFEGEKGGIVEVLGRKDCPTRPLVTFPIFIVNGEEWGKAVIVLFWQGI